MGFGQRPNSPSRTCPRGWHNLRMSSKRAVVTGASSGIGAASARALAAAGYQVICAARRTDRIEALAAEIGGVAVTCDVTRDDAVADLAEAVGDRLDLLVNNAGGALGQNPVAQAEIDALLAKAGTDKTRILRAQIFLADMGDFTGMNQAWDEWVAAGHTPPRATVQAALARPEWKVEIVVTAAV